MRVSASLAPRSVETTMEGMKMDGLLLWIGRVAGVGGVVLCAVAAAMRLSGDYWLGSFQLITLFQGGIAAMIVGCLCFLVLLREWPKAGR